ncbi:hypothetical protein ACQ4M3_17105 [Leptolyngbya sp. AN03gr2]|uniref:hypothetical protein n=1 Tax=unclassified Leptolyngbya TaxID=2650499 RepID=UPI003D31F64E
MTLPDTSQRLRNGIIDQDINALRGAKGILGYTPGRPEADLITLGEIERKLHYLYELEIQAKAKHRALLDEVREIEWKFHQGVQAMKSSVLAQYGKNSHQAESIGYKKLENHKRPKRKKSQSDELNKIA